VQVPLNLTGVRAVRPLLITPVNYSQIEQTLLKLNLPSQPPQLQQQQLPTASAEGMLKDHFMLQIVLTRAGSGSCGFC